MTEATIATQAETDLAIYPLSAERWPDLEALFGPDGADEGCWCMWWRLAPAAFKAGAGEGNKAEFKRIVLEGGTPGLLGYVDGEPAAWCSVAKRETMLRIPTSNTWKPIDEDPAWSINCFYVAPGFRGRRLATRMLAAAVAHACEHGAELVEGYPRDGVSAEEDASGLYFGTVSMFASAGFVEAARRNPNFPIMRLRVEREIPRSEA